MYFKGCTTLLVYVDNAILIGPKLEQIDGIVQAMDFMVVDAVARGDLVEVLSAFRVPGPPVHALTPPRLRRLPRVSVVLDALQTLSS